MLFAIYRLLFRHGDAKPETLGQGAAASRCQSGSDPPWANGKSPFLVSSSPLAQLREVIPPFLICGAVLLFVQRMTPHTWVAGAADARNYLITQLYVGLLYFKTFFWPSGLSADYDLNPFTTINDPRFWAGLTFAVLFTFCAIAFSISKKARVIGFGLLWFLITLSMTSLFPLAEVMNDHRTFLPYIGLVIATAGVTALLVCRGSSLLPTGRQRLPLQSGDAREHVSPKIAATFAVVLFLCASSYATFQRNKVWKTEETLWHDVVIKSPGNGRGLMNYGNTLMAKGDYAGALDYFHRAQQLTPHYSVLFINLAIAEDASKQSALAEQHFKDEEYVDRDDDIPPLGEGCQMPIDADSVLRKDHDAGRHDNDPDIRRPARKS